MLRNPEKGVTSGPFKDIKAHSWAPSWKKLFKTSTELVNERKKMEENLNYPTPCNDK